MNIEIGTKVWLQRDGDPLEVVNIKINQYGSGPVVYFDNGGDMPVSAVFEKAEAWG